MTTVINGLAGGAVAALVAVTAARLVGIAAPAPAALETVFGERATLRRWRFVSSLLYGSAAGGVLVALDLYVFGVLGVPPAIGEALTAAILWSGALFGTVVAIRHFALGRPSDRSSLGGLLAFHLAYGLALGIWIRVTWIT